MTEIELATGVDDQQRLVLTVESDQLEHGCPGCGVLAVGHGRRCRVLHDAPSLGRVTVLRWLSRVWRCLEPDCATTTFTEQHPVAPPRAILTVRAVRWATDALSHDDTTVSALARHLGVAWHTAWTAIETEAKARVGRPERLAGARLGRTLKAWRQQVLAYFDTSGVSNGGTEAINLIIEKTRRLAHGFRDFDHYRLRILLAASGNRAYRG